MCFYKKKTHIMCHPAGKTDLKQMVMKCYTKHHNYKKIHTVLYIPSLPHFTIWGSENVLEAQYYLGFGDSHYFSW